MKFQNDIQREIYYISQIDCSYWMIQEISNHVGKMESPITAMVDAATGFDKERVKMHIKQVKYLAWVIIRCKKKIGYDVTNDRKFLSELIKMEKETK